MLKTTLFSIFFIALLCCENAYANKCSAYGARSLSSTWNWHYPKETPTIRNGNRKLLCRNGRQGWLYTRDDIAGTYFVADTNWARRTRIHVTPCDAVAQFCSQ